MSQNCSIWLVPDRDSDVFEQLDHRISALAETHRTPDFVPHVTVHGGLSIGHNRACQYIREATQQFSPIELSFLTTQCSTTPHQCVFLLVDSTVEILQLRRELTEHLGLSAEMYVPHLSLVYGDIDIQTRRELTHLLREDSLPSNAVAPTMEIWDTAGPVED